MCHPNQNFSAVPAAEAQDPLDLKQTCLFLWAHQQFYKLAVKFHQILAQPDLNTQRDTVYKIHIFWHLYNHLYTSSCRESTYSH